MCTETTAGGGWTDSPLYLPLTFTSEEEKSSYRSSSSSSSSSSQESAPSSPASSQHELQQRHTWTTERQQVKVRRSSASITGRQVVEEEGVGEGDDAWAEEVLFVCVCGGSATVKSEFL